MPRQQRPSREQIIDRLRAFVAQAFRDGREDGLDAATPLVTSGIVDSAGVLEVVEFVEAQFQVEIADADVSLRNCNTLAAWADLIARKRR